MVADIGDRSGLKEKAGRTMIKGDMVTHGDKVE